MMPQSHAARPRAGVSSPPTFLWVILFLGAIVLAAFGCEKRLNWPGAATCAQQSVSALVLDAVTAIFGGGRPELDPDNMAALAAQHGAAAVKCAAVALASGPPPGVAASTPDNEIRGRAKAWIATTE